MHLRIFKDKFKITPFKCKVSLKFDLMFDGGGADRLLMLLDISKAITDSLHKGN